MCAVDTILYTKVSLCTCEGSWAHLRKAWEKHRAAVLCLCWACCTQPMLLSIAIPLAPRSGACGEGCSRDGASPAFELELSVRILADLR